MWKTFVLVSFLSLGGEGLLSEAMGLLKKQQHGAAIPVLLQAREAYPLMSAAISYNLGLAYLQIDSVELAKTFFFQSLSPLQPQAASLASNQLGLLLLREGRPREALSSFREALLFDPLLEDARYNYELLALRLGRLPPPKLPPAGSPPPDSPSPPREQPPQNLDPKMKELIQKLTQRQRQVVPPGDQAIPIGGDTLSLGEAYQILELMRKQERQYVQQLRKVSSATAEREGRPNW